MCVCAPWQHQAVHGPDPWPKASDARQRDQLTSACTVCFFSRHAPSHPVTHLPTGPATRLSTRVRTPAITPLPCSSSNTAQAIITNTSIPSRQLAPLLHAVLLLLLCYCTAAFFLLLAPALLVRRLPPPLPPPTPEAGRLSRFSPGFGSLAMQSRKGRSSTGRSARSRVSPLTCGSSR